ncbi:hypothetical protein [Clostridium hydrogenum]|nr:hypothetical protein [Clostridium hydrogenum]
MNRNKKTKNIKQNKAINDITQKNANNMSNSKIAFNDNPTDKNK